MLNVNMFDQPLDWQHPLFKYEVRHIGCLPTDHFKDDCRRFSTISLVAAGCAIGIFCCVIIIIIVTSSRPNTMSLLELFYTLVSWLLLGGIFVGMLVDLASVIITLDSHTTRAQLDLMKLANIPAEQIVQHKYAASLWRVWRVVTIATNTRLAVVGWIILLFLVNNAGAMGLVLAAVLIGYIAEPRRRVRVLVASGLALSAHIPQKTLAAIATLGIIVLLWTGQIGVFGFFWWMAFSDNSDALGAFWFAACLVCVILGIVMYLFYKRLESFALRAAIRRISDSED